MGEGTHARRVDDDVVDDILVGDLIDVHNDLVDIDVVDSHKLLDDGLLHEGRGIDWATGDDYLAGRRRATVDSTIRRQAAECLIDCELDLRLAGNSSRLVSQICNKKFYFRI